MVANFFSFWNKPLFLQVGRVRVFPIGPLASLAALVFLFGAWKRLKEDYQDDDIVAFSLGGLLTWIIFARLGFLFLNNGFRQEPSRWFAFWIYPGFDFWAGTLFFIAFVILFCKRYDWIFWDTVEKLTPVLSLSFFLVALGNFLSYPRLFSGVMVLLILLVIFLGLYLKNYRSFLWYRSGRVGFLPLAVLGLFALLDALWRFVFVGFGEDVVVGGIVVTACLLGIYLLSGRRADIL